MTESLLMKYQILSSYSMSHESIKKTNHFMTAFWLVANCTGSGHFHRIRNHLQVGALADGYNKEAKIQFT